MTSKFSARKDLTGFGMFRKKRVHSHVIEKSQKEPDLANQDPLINRFIETFF